MILDETLKRQVFTPNGRALFWSGSDPCQYFYGEKPRLSSAKSVVKLETTGTLSLGLGVAGKCLTPISWNGIIQFDVEPYVTPNLMLKLRVTNINLYDPKHEKTLIVGRGFDLIKGYYIPRIQTFNYDLSTPIHQLGELAELGAAPDVAARIKVALSTMRATPPVLVDDEGLRVMVEITVPTVPTPIVSGTPGPLTAAEIDAWETSLDQWDAFFVFATKQVGLTSQDKQLREQLFDLLIDSRYRLVDAIEHPQPSNGPDPVRLLFLDTWSQFVALVQSAAQRGMLGSRALEFLSFISAGDALFALDQAAPALGVRISADGLRRLAHLMAPTYAADPLKFDFDQDPELQKLFGISQPLETAGSLMPAPPSESPTAESIASPTPQPSESPTAQPILSPTERPSPSPTQQPSASPTAESSASPAQSQTPATTPSPSPVSSPLSLLEHWLFDSSEVFAGGNPIATQLQDLGEKLKRVVVNAGNANSYHNQIERLLILSGQRELQDDSVDSSQHRVYMTLVKSAAWQESCWRQFVMRDGNVRWLESSTGDLGLMQVNKHVWRGFYDLQRLRWDVVYNAGAGDQILMRMMRHANDMGAGKSGRSSDLARSAYCAYNGGPAAWGRWRRRNVPADVRRIDSSFWQKYQAIDQDQSFDILKCAAEWGHPR
ncbi:MAG: transglycosylase SLT domain-containing protein [Candidatus Binataceae bacterium]